MGRCWVLTFLVTVVLLRGELVRGFGLGFEDEEEEATALLLMVAGVGMVGDLGLAKAANPPVLYVREP